MRLTSRLCAYLVCSVAAVSLTFAYLQIRTSTRAQKRDLERHSQELGESLARSAQPLVEDHSYHELQRLVDRYKDRRQIAGLAIYGLGGELLAISSDLQPRLDQHPEPVTKAIDDGLMRSGFLQLGDTPMHVVAIPLRNDSAQDGVLAIFHDATYINAQAAAEWRRALFGIGIQTLVIAIITSLIIHLGFGRPMMRMAEWMRKLRTGIATEALQVPEREEFRPLTQEVTRIASSLMAARAAAEEEARLREAAESHWTAERLRIFVQNRLNGDRLFAVSNREPYEHVRRDCRIECVGSGQRPGDRARAGICAPATEPGSRRRPATPTAKRWMSTTACACRPTIRSTRCAASGSTKEEEQGFYFGFANEGLWPLCHIAHTRPTFRAEDWEHYQAVNRKFADALLEEMEGEEQPAGAGAGLSLRAAAAHDQGARARMRAWPSSGTFRGRIRRRSASARGSANCWTACWART